MWCEVLRDEARQVGAGLLSYFFSPAAAFGVVAAGLDEGLPSFSLPNLIDMENPYSHKKSQ